VPGKTLNTDFLVANVRVILRPAEAGDQDFLYRLYASTRADEMALVNWTDEQKEAFLRMQFNAQTEHYQIHYPNAEYHILQREDAAIGRLITNRSHDQLLIIDIALLPEYRNAGIGTTLIQDLMDEARQAHVPLVLRVEFFNPVIRLYTRLGFVKTREVNAVYHEMIWTPA
jgi:ribosomal protein S18 acetylase RimI-like enzyme